jgi:hypothetical protein
LLCNKLLHYGVSERYSSGAADERLHTFVGQSPGAISIEEVFPEDPNRAIIVEVKGTFTSQTPGTVKVNDGGNRPACLSDVTQNLVPATMTLSPASNFAIGKDQTLLSTDLRSDIHIDERLSIGTA